VFHVSTTSNRKVPFQVRNENNAYTLEFTYHRVVDFNVTIRNKFIVNPFRKQTLKASIESKFFFFFFLNQYNRLLLSF
jgi:hypothetical protein